jgi:general secretion pathway protein G
MHSLKITRTTENENSANRSEYLSLKPVDLSKGNSRGFTLIELLVALTIVAILASIAMNSFSAFQNNAKTVRCVAEIREFERIANDHAIEKGAYPADYAELATYVGRELVDPWGQRYVYLRYENDDAAMRYFALGVPLNTDFDLYSKGLNTISDLFVQDPISADDIFRARNGGFVGVPSSYLDSI